MTHIFPANKNIFSILGKQEYTRDDSYRLSFFCLCEPVEDGTLIFNNLTKEFVFIDSPISAVKDDDYKELVEHWFFVSDSSDELKTADELAEVLRYSCQNSKRKAFTILPTTGCNARCFYCFERDIRPQTMSSETAIKVAQYVVKNSKDADSVTLRWFGGEPLLNVSSIDLICEHLRNNTNIQYTSSMVSNGYLFNEELVNHAVASWNLKNIQITLDGTEENYNKIKSYVYHNCNAYSVVLKNLSLLNQHNLNINIRLNIDEYNITDMRTLVTELSDLLSSRDHVSITPVPLFERAGATERPRSEEQRTLLLQKISALSDYIYSLGFNQHIHLDTSIHVLSCGADNKNSVVILPNGDMLRCEHINTSPVQGNILLDSSMSEGVWTQYCSPIPICNSCPKYPSCQRLVGCTELEFCSPAIKAWHISDMRKSMLSEYKRYQKNKSHQS